MRSFISFEAASVAATIRLTPICSRRPRAPSPNRRKNAWKPFSPSKSSAAVFI
ncbi:hypothetical protein EVA_09058 [gut metagenome]|uniref:Uncharacterized protein n=1 Tax=gut metagenome TaxID=749906 RepID=J9G6H0_9ZZZZ